MGWIAGSSRGCNPRIRMSNPGQTRRSAPTLFLDYHPGQQICFLTFPPTRAVRYEIFVENEMPPT
ncbi:MAG: hypothetical protein WD098_04920 [Balneolales bacterium]